MQKQALTFTTNYVFTKISSQFKRRKTSSNKWCWYNCSKTMTMEIVWLLFLLLWQNTWQETHKERRIDFCTVQGCSSLQWGNQSGRPGNNDSTHCIQSGSREKQMLVLSSHSPSYSVWSPSQWIGPTTFSESLPWSFKLFWKHLHRHSLRYFQGDPKSH